MGRAISVGVLGCGKQAEKHVRALKAARSVEVTATDIDVRLAETFCREQRVRRAPSVEALIDDRSIDAVLVCTPTPSHVDLVARSLRSGKQVFCEKPLCRTVAEAEALLGLEASTGRFVMVGHIYRFVPAFEEAQRAFRMGPDGSEPLMGRLAHALFRIGGRGSHRAWKHSRAESGGVVSEMLVHMVDLMHWFFGPAADSRFVAHRLLWDRRRIGGREVMADVEDYAVLECRLERGGTAVVLADMVTPSFQQYVDLQAANGSFFGSIRPEMPNELFVDAARGHLKTGRTVLAPSADLYERQMKSFLACVETGGPPDRNRVAESLTVMQTLEQARSRTGSEGPLMTVEESR